MARVAEELLTGKQSAIDELELDYRLKEADLDRVKANLEKAKSGKNEVETLLSKATADLQGAQKMLVTFQSAVEEGKATIATLEARKGEVESELEVARSDDLAKSKS